MIGVTVLGSTGSIGVSTLDVLARHSDKYRAVALTANSDVAKMLEQCRACRPDYAVMADEDAAEALLGKLQQAGLNEIQVLSGEDGSQSRCGRSGYWPLPLQIHQ